MLSRYDFLKNHYSPSDSTLGIFHEMVPPQRAEPYWEGLQTWKLVSTGYWWRWFQILRFRRHPRMRSRVMASSNRCSRFENWLLTKFVVPIMFYSTSWAQRWQNWVNLSISRRVMSKTKLRAAAARKLRIGFGRPFTHIPSRQSQVIPSQMQKTASKFHRQFSRSGTVMESHFLLSSLRPKVSHIQFRFAQ